MLLWKWKAMTATWKGAFCQARTHQRAMLLALALLCGVGRRTITRALGFLDKEQQDWSADYRFFSRSPWAPVELFDQILGPAVRTYCPEPQLIAAAVDDTVAARTGLRVPNASWQRDPLSPPFHLNLLWGQRFMQVSLLLPLYRQDPQSSPRALPVRFAECQVVRKPGKRATEQQWSDYREAKKKHNLSAKFVEVSQELRARLDAQGLAHRGLLITGDGSFCNRKTYRPQIPRTYLLTRARKDLKLCFRHSGPGRRFYGQQKFTPQSVYQDPQRRWQWATLFHGGRFRRVRYKEVTDVLWQGGAGRKALRLLVLAPTPYKRTRKGRRYLRRKAFLLTDDLHTAAAVLLQHYFDRFEIEFNHRDEKSILGVNEAQVWSPQSVPRVPEFKVAAYSALLFAGLEAYGPQRTQDYLPQPKWRRGARRPSCQDLVTLLRKQFDEAREPLPCRELELPPNDEAKPRGNKVIKVMTQGRFHRYRRMILSAAA
jgi:hypothetical protein